MDITQSLTLQIQLLKEQIFIERSKRIELENLVLKLAPSSASTSVAATVATSKPSNNNAALPAEN
jgi:hypothetical protein